MIPFSIIRGKVLAIQHFVSDKYRLVFLHLCTNILNIHLLWWTFIKMTELCKLLIFYSFHRSIYQNCFGPCKKLVLPSVRRKWNITLILRWLRIWTMFGLKVLGENAWNNVLTFLFHFLFSWTLKLIFFLHKGT